MQPEKELKWLFLDLNSYFASVEQQDNPALRGKPVAVVPMETDHTCAIAASYEAKAFGVRTGTMIHEAKKLCPGLQCVLARHDAYVRYHHKILAEVDKHTAISKVWSIDEFSSQLPPNKRNKEAATVIAQQIREGIWQNLGEVINCSIGIAQNSLLAKIATDMQKPNGLVILEPAALPDLLFKMKLRELPGIGANMEVRLHQAGITTVEQFWHLSPKHARQIWGSVQGEKFWYLLHGYSVPDTETKRGTIGHSRILDPALRLPDAARQVARRLTIKAASRLRGEDFYAGSFTLSVRCVEDRRWAGEMRMPPAKDNFSFLKVLDDLWARMLQECKPHKLKKISICMMNLHRQQEITPDLFDRVSLSYKKEAKKNEALSNVMDKLNEKYGAETLQLGISPKTKAGFVGTKIAFSRVPALDEFYR